MLHYRSPRLRSLDWYHFVDSPFLSFNSFALLDYSPSRPFSRALDALYAAVPGLNVDDVMAAGGGRNLCMPTGDRA